MLDDRGAGTVTRTVDRSQAHAPRRSTPAFAPTPSAPRTAAWLVARPDRYTRAVRLHAALRAERPAGVPVPASARLRRLALGRFLPALRPALVGAAIRWADAVGPGAATPSGRGWLRRVGALLAAPLLVLAALAGAAALAVVAALGTATWALLAVGAALRAPVARLRTAGPEALGPPARNLSRH